LAAGR